MTREVTSVGLRFRSRNFTSHTFPILIICPSCKDGGRSKESPASPRVTNSHEGEKNQWARDYLINHDNVAS